MDTQTYKKSEHGNVIFYILIAVALLAALSFAIAESTRGNVSQLNGEKARLYATEILEYANIISNAVAQLRLRGCDETEISFEHSTVAGYTNAGSPGDNSCHIFDINGGGVERVSALTEAMDAAATPDYIWHIYDENEIEDVGTTSGDADGVDLILVVDELNQSVCKEINDKLGVTNPSDAPPVDTALSATEFTGSYSFNSVIGDEDTALLGKSAGCFEDQTTGKYTFYKVLIAR